MNPVIIVVLTFIFLITVALLMDGDIKCKSDAESRGMAVIIWLMLLFIISIIWG